MNRLLFRRICLLLFIGSHSNIFSQSLKIVPSDNFSTIQSAVAHSEDGDTVLVNPGTYHGVVDFMGKDILVTPRFRITNDTSFITNTIIPPDPTNNLTIIN